MRRPETPFAHKLPSDQTFFGLTSEYDQKVMDQIFELVYFGKGGFTFEAVYNMPVNVRSYYYVKLAKILEEQAAAAEAAASKRR